MDLRTRTQDPIVAGNAEGTQGLDQAELVCAAGSESSPISESSITASHTAHLADVLWKNSEANLRMTGMSGRDCEEAPTATTAELEPASKRRSAGTHHR